MSLFVHQTQVVVDLLAAIKTLLDTEYINKEACDAACSFVDELTASALLTARVFTHGQNSVVFNWTDGRSNVYVTVGPTHRSLLTSVPERITGRMDYSPQALAAALANCQST